MKSKSIGAAEFKANCLRLANRVRETGIEYIVTNHGRPVAKLVPYTDAARPALFGAMAGSVLAYERPFDPVGGDYDIDRG